MVISRFPRSVSSASNSLLPIFRLGGCALRITLAIVALVFSATSSSTCLQQRIAASTPAMISVFGMRNSALSVERLVHGLSKCDQNNNNRKKQSTWGRYNTKHLLTLTPAGVESDLECVSDGDSPKLSTRPFL